MAVRRRRVGHTAHSPLRCVDLLRGQRRSSDLWLLGEGEWGTLLPLRCAVLTYCAASDGPPTRLEGAERLPLASSARTKYSNCRVEGAVSVNVAVEPVAVTRVTKLGAPGKP